MYMTCVYGTNVAVAPGPDHDYSWAWSYNHVPGTQMISLAKAEAVYTKACLLCQPVNGPRTRDPLENLGGFAALTEPGDFR